VTVTRDGVPAPDIVVQLAIDGVVWPIAMTGSDGVALWEGLVAGTARVTAWEGCPGLDGRCDPYFTPEAAEVGLGEGRTSVSLAIQHFSLDATTSGVISWPEVWAGEIHVTGSVIVAEGGSLTIAPGTRVLVSAEDDGRYLDEMESIGSDRPRLMGLGGPIVALGTAAAPITIEAAEPGARWGGMSGWLDLRSVTMSGFDGYGGIPRDQTFRQVTMIGEGQAECARFAGGQIHLWNSVFVECSVQVDLPPGEDGEVVVENDTFVTTATPDLPAVRFVTPLSEEFITQHVVFRNDLVSGRWAVGVALGGQPFPGDSVWGHNAFFDWGPKRGQWNPQYVYEGTYHRANGSVLTGTNAIDWIWSDNFQKTWSSTRNADALNAYAQFIPGTYRPQYLDCGDTPATMCATAIDWGDPELRDADGSPSDIGAFGGPGSNRWDDDVLVCPDLVPESLCLVAYAGPGVIPNPWDATPGSPADLLTEGD